MRDRMTGEAAGRADVEPDSALPADAAHGAVDSASDPWAAQRSIGLTLASLIIGAWLYLHVATVFSPEALEMPPLAVILIVAVQTWLSVGMFIVAHDAMHGSLAPFRPRLSRAIGSVALALFAGLSFDRLAPKHFAHHRHAGTEDDPDFDAGHPQSFGPWFLTFMREHVGWPEILSQTAIAAVYLFVFGVGAANLLVFWALPAILATVQLFYFGTYRPHRHGHEPFTDHHRARSDDFPGWLSLLTCFNFGHHHEHHEAPHVPWWKLPGYRRRRGG